MEANLEVHPEATLPQRREFLRRVDEISLSESTISRMLRSIVPEALEAERLVFLNETEARAHRAGVPVCLG